MKCMKSNIYIRLFYAFLTMSLTLLGLTSCNKSSHDSDDVERKIGFYPNANPYSKSGIITDDISLRSLTEGFSVSAAIKIGESDEVSSFEPILVNRKVQYVVADNKWSYAPEQYWSRGYTYYFGAYAPRLTALVSSTEKYVYSDPKLRNVMFYNIPQYQDVFLTAQQNQAFDLMTDGQVGEYSDFESGGGKVKFELKHQLAYLEIRAFKVNKAIMQGREYKIHTLTVGDADNKMAQQSFRDYIFNYEDNSNSVWTECFKASDGKLVLVSSPTNQSNLRIQGDVNGDVVVARYLIAPFVIGNLPDSGLPIEIQYQYTDIATGVPSDIKTISGKASIKKFDSGLKYILTLRFDTGEQLGILDPIIVEDWSIGGDNENPVYNW